MTPIPLQHSLGAFKYHITLFWSFYEDFKEIDHKIFKISFCSIMPKSQVIISKYGGFIGKTEKLDRSQTISNHDFY